MWDNAQVCISLPQDTETFYKPKGGNNHLNITMIQIILFLQCVVSFF